MKIIATYTYMDTEMYTSFFIMTFSGDFYPPVVLPNLSVYTVINFISTTKTAQLPPSTAKLSPFTAKLSPSTSMISTPTTTVNTELLILPINCGY